MKRFSLGVKIGKVKLKNPVMVASGTFGYGKEFEGLTDLKKLGAIVTKTITLEARQGNSMPRISETASGMLNAIGLQNEGVDDFIKQKMPYLKKTGVPVFVSISANDLKELKELIKRLDKTKGISGIELNISCPNLRRRGTRDKEHGLVAQDPLATLEFVRTVRRNTSKTLVTKLSPNVTDITEIAKAACKGGTDAVSLINTFFGMAIDIETGKPKLGNVTGGLSGPCIKPISLRMVWEVANRIDRPVIGMGGIMTAEDAIEFMLAGATAVQVGTANFVDPDVAGKIIKGITKWTKKKS